MSEDLQQARDWYAAGHDRKALGALWNAQDAARRSPDEMQAVLDLACAIRHRAKSKVQTDADRLVRSADRQLARLDKSGRTAVIVKLLSCRVAESAGWEPSLTGIWDLIFTEAALLLRGDQMITLEYPSIRSIELEKIPLAFSTKARRLSGKAGVILAIGTLSGGDAAWEAAREQFPDQHRVRITLTTAACHAVLVGTSSDTVDQLKKRMPVASRTLNAQT